MLSAFSFPLLTRATLDTPQILSYQGRLTDSNKVPVADGPQAMKFVIYDASVGGSCVWSAGNTDANTATIDCGAPGSINVTVTDGLFNVLLGDVNDPSANAQNLFPDSLFNTSSERWLEVQIGAETLTPRRRIVSSATALQAGNASLLDGFNTSQTGGIAAFVPVTESDGDLILSANFTVDTDTFYVDAGNNRVLVGSTTSLAGAKFEVINDANSTTQAYVVNPNSGNAAAAGYGAQNDLGVYGFFGLYGSNYSANSEYANRAMFETNAAGLGLNATAGGDIRFFGNTTERMRITNAGNIGIGDTSPAAMLTVGSGDLFQVNSSGAIAAATGITSSGTINFTDSVILGSDATDTVTVNGTLLNASPLVFEGATADGFETTLAVTDPTADRTITIPNISGTVMLASAALTNGSVLFADSSGLISQNNSNFFWDNATTRLGLGTNAPSADLSFGNGANRTVLVERVTSGGGRTLTVQSGGAQSGGSNQSGGDLNLSSGISTGSGGSNINFYAANPGSSGTTDRTPSLRLVIQGDGLIRPGTGAALSVSTTFSGNGGDGNTVTERAVMKMSSTNVPLLFRSLSGNVSVRRCVGPSDSCSSLSSTTLATGTVSTQVGAVIANDGFPTVYYKSGANTLSAVHCTDATCTTVGTPNAIAHTLPGNRIDVYQLPNTPAATAIAVGDGSTVRYFVCNNPESATPCSSVGALQSIAQSHDGMTITVMESGGVDYPVIGVVDGTNYRTIACTDTTCASVTNTNHGGGPSSGQGIKMASERNADGLAAFAMSASGTDCNYYFVVKCTNLSCTGVTTLISESAGACAAFIGGTSATVGLARHPTTGILYSQVTGGSAFGTDAQTVVRVRRCDNVNCTSTTAFGATQVTVGNTGINSNPYSDTSYENPITIRPNGDIVTAGLTTLGNSQWAIVEIGAGSPSYTGISLGNSLNKFANGSFAGDVDMRRLTASDFIQINGNAADSASVSNGAIMYNSTSSKLRCYEDGAWQNCVGTSEIGGDVLSGTAGSVLFVDTGGVLAQDNANYYWDNTNDRLGIGTNAPDHAIHVNKTLPTLYFTNTALNQVNSGTILFAETDDDTSAMGIRHNGSIDGLQFYTDVFTNLLTLYRGGSIVVNDDSDNIDFRIEGDSQTHLFFTDASTDRVGIGTAAPTSRLTVGDSASTVEERLIIQSQADAVLELSADTDNAVTENDNPYILLRQDTGGNNTHSVIGLQGDLVDTAMNGEPFIGAGRNNALLIGNFGQDPILIGTNARTIFTMEGMNDYVGLYTLAPQNSFQVSPVQYETGTASQTGTTITGVGTTFTSAMVGSLFTFNDGTVRTITAFTDATTLTVAESGAVASQNFRINYRGFNVTSAGRVGVGTLSPTVNFEVMTPDSDVNALVRVNDPNGNGYSAYLTIDGDGAGGGGASLILSTNGTTKALLGAAGGDDISLRSQSGTGAVILGTPSNSDAFYLADSGNIGIGDVSPTEARLVVGNAGAGDIYASFATANTERLCWDGTGASLITDCTGSPGDYAEMYGTTDATVEAGDLVMMDGANPATELTVDGYQTTKGFVLKATQAGAAQLLGVVSTQPNEVIGETVTPAENPRPVALSGRIPVKVNDENGPIAVGDAITVSSVPGVGMRATENSMIIGHAMNTWAGPGQGTVIVTVRTEWWNGASGALLAADGSLSMPGTQFSVKKSGTEVFSVNQTGDVFITGKLYPSDKGIAQSSAYIYYDSAMAPMDYMRTNASGWATGSYDFAELFPSKDTSIQAGELVMIDTENPEHIVRARYESRDLLMGIVSTRPGFLAGEWDNNQTKYAIALAGRVPTKVTTENGTIKKGDPLTISSKPGIAMKASTAGNVVGYALEDADQDKTIIVLVRSQYFAPTNSASSMPTSAAVVSTFDIHQDLDMKGYALMNLREIKGIKWSIDAEGNVVAAEVRAEKIAIRQTEKVVSLETVTFPQGAKELLVENPAVQEKSEVFLSWQGNVGSFAYVAEKRAGAFIIKSAAPSEEDAKVSYWIVDVIDERPPAAEVNAPAQEGPATEPVAESVVSTEIADPVISAEVAEPTVSTEVAEIVVEDPPVTPAPAQEEQIIAPQELVSEVVETQPEPMDEPVQETPVDNAEQGVAE